MYPCLVCKWELPCRFYRKTPENRSGQKLARGSKAQTPDEMCWLSSPRKFQANGILESPFLKWKDEAHQVPLASCVLSEPADLRQEREKLAAPICRPLPRRPGVLAATPLLSTCGDAFQSKPKRLVAPGAPDAEK